MPSSNRKKGKLNRYGRRRLRYRILLVALPLVLLGGLAYQLWQLGMLPANEAATEWYEAEENSRALVKIPDDDALHDDQTEWWYYNGHLRAQDGKRYSFHVALFVINRLAGYTIIHSSFLDHQSGKHYSAQQRTAGKPNDAVQDGFDFRLGQWHIAGAGGRDQLVVQTPDYSLQLTLTGTTDTILHGETGLLDFKAAGTSYYYSRPRMTVTGTAGPTGQASPVSGEAWFDHQWGNFSVTSLGWNWFALQLEDGRDVMLFELFTPAGEKVVHFGTVSSDTILETLDEDAFVVTPTGEWQSPTTKIRYPMGWNVRIPSQALELQLQPISQEAEFDGRQSSYLIYWEGPVEITGSDIGRGFVEMSGYTATR